MTAFVDQALLRMDTGRFPRRDRPRANGHERVAPRQVRLHGAVPDGSYLELAAAGAVSTGLWLELRDVNGRRFLCVPVRHVALDAVAGGTALAVELEAVLVVPGDGP